MYKIWFLLKFKMIVGIDSYIFDVFGFYFVDYYNNDVVIIKYLLFINESVKNWF